MPQDDMAAMENPEQIRMMRAQFAQPVSALALRWGELHETAGEIAGLAQLAREPFEGLLASFPERVTQAGEQRAYFVRRGLDDIDAMLQPGLTALRLIASRGLDTTAPALALWREFYYARAGLLAICPPVEVDRFPNAAK